MTEEGRSVRVAALHDDFRSPTARPHHRRIRRIGLDLAEQFAENGFDLLITAASNRPRRLWVPGTVSRPLIGAFAANRPRSAARKSPSMIDRRGFRRAYLALARALSWPALLVRSDAARDDTLS